jgi:hypothetical protein
MTTRFDRKRVEYSGPAHYRIMVDGHLEEDLSDFLAGMQIQSIRREDGTSLTILTGPIVDQAELNGVVIALFEMHLAILAVEVLPEHTGDSETGEDPNVAS